LIITRRKRADKHFLIWQSPARVEVARQRRVNSAFRIKARRVVPRRISNSYLNVLRAHPFVKATIVFSFFVTLRNAEGSPIIVFY